MENKKYKANSHAEDLFLEIFSEVFGPDKLYMLHGQYHFIDIYGKNRYLDFALENHESKIAIEIDGETYHNPAMISAEKYYDDLLKQNSMIHQNWKVYRWAYKQLANKRELVKDELVHFLGETPFFKEMFSYLPNQKGSALTLQDNGDNEKVTLRDHQQEALDKLIQMRKEGETIALLYHATGTGKTFTACSDAKVVGGKTLFLAHQTNLIDQAEISFHEIWPEATTGLYTGSQKNKCSDIVLATIQTISRNLLEFSPNQFDYIIIDECHHAAAQTYKKILGYFRPKFILGLSATPERHDGEDILNMFKNIAHKMDLKTAIETGILAPIRCVRVRTDIDISNVRYNGIKYNVRDLDDIMFLTERNNIIVDTYIEYVKNKKTIIFCASVKHANEMASLLRKRGIESKSVSGIDSIDDRKCIYDEYENGTINVLCACDLLNEGFDSPRTEVLFMARPTMSKTVYMQQIGRGTRLCEGKTDLVVFDFVDVSNLFNQPYSLHRLLGISAYRAYNYVLAPQCIKEEQFLAYKNNRPELTIDTHINIIDMETIDLFNWQEEAKGMLSVAEFIKRVDVSYETINKYIVTGRVKADMEVPISENRKFYYFKLDTIENYAKKYKWELITNENIVNKFIKFISKMTMTRSYKPVLVKAIFHHADERGRVKISDLVNYFIEFYDTRKLSSKIIEKENSIYTRDEYSVIDVEKDIIKNPFKRFLDMNFFNRSKEIEYIEINPIIFKNLNSHDIKMILDICDDKLDKYYKKLEKNKFK